MISDDLLVTLLDKDEFQEIELVRANLPTENITRITVCFQKNTDNYVVIFTESDFYVYNVVINNINITPHEGGYKIGQILNVERNCWPDDLGPPPTEYHLIYEMLQFLEEHGWAHPIVEHWKEEHSYVFK